MFDTCQCETCGVLIGPNQIYKKQDGSLACETCVMIDDTEYEYKNMSNKDFMFSKYR